MTDIAIALAATKSACKSWFVNNYAGGPKTIKYREPTTTALWYMTLRSWDFAKVAGCSSAAARRRLTALVERGDIAERDRISGVRGWTPNKPDAERIAREIIAELRAEGLPFDDEWRDAGRPKTWPPGAPVPAQPAEAEGVEALAIDVGAVVGMEYKGGPLAEAAFSRAQLHEFARRLRNSPESTGLLSLLADIRAAAGDPTGKLMQDELVAHVRALREDAERMDAMLRNSWDLRCFDMPTPGGDDADIGWRVIEHHRAEPQERVVAEVYHDDPRAAIDAARSAGGDDA